MKAYWSDTRPNGQPVQPGTVCWITDLEDGSNPIATYGKDQEEVLRKLANQNANAQLALARKALPRGGPAAPAAPAAPERRQISPDQVMRATQDLENPAKAGEAIATLVEAHTGIDLGRLALQGFAQLAMEWEQENPGFYPHPGNKRLLSSEAARIAGGIPQVTKAHLSQALANLQARGELLEATAAPQNPTDPPSNSFPDESQVQRERPRGTRFATGARSASFQRQVQTPQRNLKYTEEQIRAMSPSKSRQLIESNDPDYAAACEHYFGSPQAQTA